MVMHGKVLWIVSLAFRDFFFLQVMGDNFLLLLLVLTIFNVNDYFLVFNIDNVLYCILDNAHYGISREVV